jgi:hypothetical protein
LGAIVEKLKLNADRLLVGCIIILSILFGVTIIQDTLRRTPPPNPETVYQLIKENKQLLEENIKLIKDSQTVLLSNIEAESSIRKVLEAANTELRELKLQQTVLENEIKKLLNDIVIMKEVKERQVVLENTIKTVLKEEISQLKEELN